MATLDEMTRAGYKPVQKKSSTDQIMGLLAGAQQQAAKQQEKEKADVMDQVKLYGELRKAGYSTDDAHERVTRSYRSTSFIEKMLGGEDKNAFKAPTEEDDVSLDRRKAKAELGKTKSETRKNVATAQYYEKGGASGKNNDKLTPNQIQTRIKYLRENELGMGDREDADINSEIDHLTELFNKKSGFREDAPADKGAAESVVMTGPDGKDYRIPNQNKARAVARGFKEKPVR